MNNKNIYTLTVWRHNRSCGYDYYFLSLKQALSLIEDLTVGNTCVSHPDNLFELKPHEGIL